MAGSFTCQAGVRVSGGVHSWREFYPLPVGPGPTRKPHQAGPGGAFKGEVDDGLLSHHLSVAVPSALQGLTAVFGMGTGVAPARYRQPFFESRVASHGSWAVRPETRD